MTRPADAAVPGGGTGAVAASPAVGRLPAMVARLVRLSAAALTTLVLSLAGVVLVDAPAFACSCTAVSFGTQVDQAEAVFLGDVESVSPADGSQLTYAVQVSRVFKGELASSAAEVTTASQPSACGLGELPPGTTYLFLTTGGVTSICHGSKPADDQVMQRVERLLGPGTEPPPPAPTSATRTRVEDSPPQELARLAAPGAALVLLGLLGLLVVRRVERP